MKGKKLLWRIFSSFLVITLLFLLVVTWFSSSAFRAFYVDQIEADLEHSAVLVRFHLKPLLEDPNPDVQRIDRVCKALKGLIGNRITVILRDGKVIGDSDYDIASMDPHDDRPEFQEALQSGLGTSKRFSQTLAREMLYLAIPVRHESRFICVIRAARPVTAIDEALRAFQFKIAGVWLLTALLAVAIILNLSRRITAPFEAFRGDVDRLLKGDLKGGLPAYRVEEIRVLAESLNQMASQLDQHTLTISRQRQEFETILSSMEEAVIAIDAEAAIMNMNETATTLFHLDSETCRGRKVQEVIRNQEFNRFAERVLNGEGPVLEELAFYAPQPEYYRVYGTRLRDVANRPVGAVIVLNNITRLRQLESIRKDFVASVSHELRTPVTSIQGFVETLQAGALNQREDALRFLDIIAKQTDRLNHIIEDLLSLSKIEQDRDRISLGMTPCNLRDILERAVDLCADMARAKKIALHLDCPKSITARLHANLFGQAIYNLVDNAVKYSEPNKSVWVKAQVTGNTLEIAVADQGPGISEAHLPRLFERFYRVDRARSRELGGTGLGLSIVKHIAIAHGGEVRVESELEKGSTFTVLLPHHPNSG